MENYQNGKLNSANGHLDSPWSSSSLWKTDGYWKLLFILNSDSFIGQLLKASENLLLADLNRTFDPILEKIDLFV